LMPRFGSDDRVTQNSLVEDTGPEQASTTAAAPWEG
jgi:hypothetical protein